MTKERKNKIFFLEKKKKEEEEEKKKELSVLRATRKKREGKAPRQNPKETQKTFHKRVLSFRKTKKKRKRRRKNTRK